MNDQLDLDRLETAWRLLDGWVAEDRIPAAGAVVGTSTWMSEPKFAGRQTLEPEGPPLRDDAIFLIASPTKPLTATATMMLVEAGDIELVDPLVRYVPEFSPHGKSNITLLHLLTHTSGLPDMLPDNAELRANQAPLEEFLTRVCALQPDFAPGTAVQYQSTGYLMLGEVIRRVSGLALPDFLRERVFEPLFMRDTALGMPPDWERADGDGDARRDRIAEVRLPEMSRHSAVWNGDYWRRLGAPWGGLLSTPVDWGLFLQHLLQIASGDEGILAPATLAAMTRNQLAALPEAPEVNRRCFPWGLGWQLNWPTHKTSFGGLLSESAYGHWGATGTLVWVDPARDLFAVLLTTQPLGKHERFLAKFSNTVCRAWRGPGY